MKERKPLQRGMEVEVFLERYVYGGAAEGFFKGSRVLVPYAVPGSKAKARLEFVKDNFAIAKRLIDISRSPDYSEPVCPYFGECGGCDFMDCSYEAQEKAKLSFITDSLAKTAGIETDFINPMITHIRPYNYRNRSVYMLFKSKGAVSAGFFRAKSHDIVPVERCAIVTEGINAAAAAVVSALNARAKDVEVFTPETGRGYLKFFQVREGSKGGILITFCVNGREPREYLRSAVVMLKGSVKALAGITVNYAEGAGLQDFGEKEETLYGLPYVSEIINDTEFRLNSRAFFQISGSMLKEMVKFIGARIKPNSRVIDIYGGTGALSLPLISKMNGLTVVDNLEDNIKQLNAICRFKKIRNVNAVLSDAEDAGYELIKKGGYDAAIIDPPRKGIHPKLVAALRRGGPRQIIYVSCNPQSFARDMRDLKERYFLKELTPLDQFSQTYHVETMAVLELKRTQSGEKVSGSRFQVSGKKEQVSGFRSQVSRKDGEKNRDKYIKPGREKDMGGASDSDRKKWHYRDRVKKTGPDSADKSRGNGRPRKYGGR